LSLDDLRHTDCPYCRTALPHHAQAAGQAALVNQMLAQQGVSYQVPYQYGAAPPPVANHVHQSVQAAHKTAATGLAVGIVVAVIGGVVAVITVAGIILVAMM